MKVAVIIPAAAVVDVAAVDAADDVANDNGVEAIVDESVTKIILVMNENDRFTVANGSVPFLLLIMVLLLLL